MRIRFLRNVDSYSREESEYDVDDEAAEAFIANGDAFALGVDPGQQVARIRSMQGRPKVT